MDSQAPSSESPPSPHPLLLPEILRLLGSFLAQAQLPGSLLVCKTWYHSLNPFLWHTLTLQNQPCNFTPPQPTPTLLLKHRHHVRHLIETGSNSLLKFLAFSTHQPVMQLTSISVTMLSPEILMITQQSAETLQVFRCHSNHMQKDIETHGLWCRQLFIILGMCPQLSSLSLGPMILLDDPKKVFQKVCTTLRILELDRVKLADQSLYATADNDDVTIALERISLGGVMFECLEKLTLVWNDFPPNFQPLLVRQCPALKEIIWRRRATELTSCWLSGEMSVPVGLRVLDIANSYVMDADIARVLAMIPTLEVFRASGMPFGTLSAIQLMKQDQENVQRQRHGHHGGTRIRELDVTKCVQLSSAMIQRMLMTLSGLRVFRATMLEASDIARAFLQETRGDLAENAQELDAVGSSPSAFATTTCIQAQTQVRTGAWTCLELEELDLSIQGLYRSENPDPVETRLLVFDQLSQLRQLRILALQEPLIISTPQEPKERLLELTLDTGLGRLWTLKRLQDFVVRNMAATIGTQEVEWMAREWTGLRALRLEMGPLYSRDDPKVRGVVVKMKQLRPDVEVSYV
ncbi:hypothetical protein EDD11_000273 [Mortierella claussenii]|nr:hypothetical protein EDD11_000273 [Mortierella claussenii]